MFPTDVVIVAGARTPMARYTGAFSEVSAIDLATHASKEAIKRAGVDAGDFDHAIKYEQQALQMKPATAENIKVENQRLQLYEDHKPYREEPKR